MVTRFIYTGLATTPQLRNKKLELIQLECFFPSDSSDASSIRTQVAFAGYLLVCKGTFFRQVYIRDVIWEWPVFLAIAPSAICALVKYTSVICLLKF